jgi:hypothetical protein
MTKQRNKPMRGEQRKNFRVEWNSPAKIYYGQLTRSCILSNLSNDGAKITGVRAATFPDEFMLRVTPHGRIRKCRVLWRTDDALGVEFGDRDASAKAPVAAHVAPEGAG